MMITMLLAAIAVASPTDDDITPAQTAMHRALSHRDGSPPCADVEGSEFPIATLSRPRFTSDLVLFSETGVERSTEGHVA